MRIVHLTNTVVEKAPKKTAKQIRDVRITLMLANQRIKDRADAEKFFKLLDTRK
jgi:hypothetical protein